MSASVERPGARWWVPEHVTLGTLRDAVQECKGCELHADAIQGVMGAGATKAKLMVLGEQPGDKEDQAGEPFVGPAGQLLDRALAEVGIDPGSVFRTNVVKHFRFSGTRGKQRIHKSPSYSSSSTSIRGSTWAPPASSKRAVWSNAGGRGSMRDGAS